MANDRDKQDSSAPAGHAAGAGEAQGAGAPRSVRGGRWLRWTLGSLAVLAALVLGAGWLLGRESTLQQLAQRLANASGGQVTMTGVSGSLYHRMHIARLVY